MSCAIAPCHKAGTNNQRSDRRHTQHTVLVSSVPLISLTPANLSLILCKTPYLPSCLSRGDHTCFCFRLNSVTIATGSGSSVSLNTVSFFKSAYARQHPLAPPSAYFLESDDERGAHLKAKDDEKEDDRVQPREVSDGLGHGQRERAGHTRRFSGVKEGHSSGSKSRRRSSTGTLGLEPYTMSSYYEHVKTDYISGDASVLMFGATASRQVCTALNTHTTTPHHNRG